MPRVPVIRRVTALAKLVALAGRHVRLQRLAGLVAAILLTVPAWWTWTDPRLDLAPVDDAKNHLLRLYQFFWMLDHGVWYPRWVPSMFMGYGYPVFNFYAPGTYYLSWLSHTLFRLDVWDSYRAVGVMAALLGTTGMYLLAVALWRRVPLGLLAAVVLLYGPYFIPI